MRSLQTVLFHKESTVYTDDMLFVYQNMLIIRLQQWLSFDLGRAPPVLSPPKKQDLHAKNATDSL